MGEIMQNLRELLLEEEKHLEAIIAKTSENLKSVPEGHLRISKDKNNVRYYHCMEDYNGFYIPKSDVDLPRQLAQKSYDLSVLKKAENRLKQIKKLTKNYKDDEIELLYTSLHDERQNLIIPVESTWNQIVEKWYGEEFQGKEFKEGTAIIFSEKGERVRSKSEKILADYFYRKNILYKYEKPLYLKGYGIVYPDFTFLSPHTRKEIYWEHEGMRDKPEYARAAVHKIETYQKNGIHVGENLILTFETEQSVLNSKNVEELVNKYLLMK